MSRVGPAMLFVPCSPAVAEYGPEAAGAFGAPAALEPVAFDAGDAGRHFFVATGLDALPFAVTGEWAVAGTSASKALAIRNPKTGEVIARRTLLEKPGPGKTGVGISRCAPATKPGTSTAGLSVVQRAKWIAAAKVVAQQLRMKRWYADHSMFSALNIDGLNRPPRVVSSPTDSCRSHLTQASTRKEDSKTPSSASQRTKACAGPAEQETSSAKAAALFKRSISKSDKIPASAAATLAALSLEPGVGKRGVERRVLTAAAARACPDEEAPVKVRSAAAPDDEAAPAESGCGAAETDALPQARTERLREEREVTAEEEEEQEEGKEGAPGGTEPQVHSGVADRQRLEEQAANGAATKLPWKPKRWTAQEGVDAIQEEPATSAGETPLSSLVESSDAASGEGEETCFSGEDVTEHARRERESEAAPLPAPAPPADIVERDTTPADEGAVLGDFFRAPKGKTPRARRSRTGESVTSHSGSTAATHEQAKGPEDSTVADVGESAAAPGPSSARESEAAMPSRPELASLVGAKDARNYLLSFRLVGASAPPPSKLSTLNAERVAAEAQPSDQVLPPKANSSRSVMTPSAKAYRVNSGGLLPRMEELRRTVQSLLNKICPESVVTIAEKIGEIKVNSADELEHIISLIFKKALSEPHYCETYADLVFSLKSSFPEFPCPDGGKPLTFKAILLNICQSEFEALPTSLAPSDKELVSYDAEELDFRRKKTKDRVLANMKLIGHLFLRQLLSAKVIGAIIQELTLCDAADQVPEEHVIECAVELLMSIGHTLESMPAGKSALMQVSGRLLDLKTKKGRDGRGIYCKRIQFAIQDVLDTRNAGWVRKVFGGVAKTKEEIRLEQERELVAQARGKEVQGAQVIISGQRPLYISAAKKD